MRALPLAALALLAGCATAPRAPSTPAASVTARGETEPVGTGNADAADDPAIWRNPADPAASLIVATDKKAGLYVYGLDGKRRDYRQAGRVNNVDLRDGAEGVIVAASDRSDVANAAIALFRLDTAAARLVPLGSVPAGSGEAYGMCLGNVGGRLYGFVVLKDGTIRQIALDLSGAIPAGRVVRTMKLATQSEGCVVDDRTATLYVAEEDVGIWRFGASPDAPVTPAPVAKVDGTTLVADVEGLAIAPEGTDGGYLVASSQGDNAYVLYRLRDGGYAGRFRVVAGRVGATSETDGIEVALGDFGPAYPGGLMVVQDGDNAPAAQNFKLLAWDDVIRAIRP
jgi:3-phytase